MIWTKTTTTSLLLPLSIMVSLERVELSVIVTKVIKNVRTCRVWVPICVLNFWTNNSKILCKKSDQR